MNDLWASFGAGIALLVAGVLAFPNGAAIEEFKSQVGRKGYFFFGPNLCVLSIRGLLRGDGKAQKKEYTNEDAAKAKDELEKMYLKQHGRLPGYSEEIKNTFGPDMDDRTKDA